MLFGDELELSDFVGTGERTGGVSRKPSQMEVSEEICRERLKLAHYHWSEVTLSSINIIRFSYSMSMFI